MVNGDCSLSEVCLSPPNSVCQRTRGAAVDLGFGNVLRCTEITASSVPTTDITDAVNSQMET